MTQTLEKTFLDDLDDSDDEAPMVPMDEDMYQDEDELMDIDEMEDAIDQPDQNQVSLDKVSDLLHSDRLRHHLEMLAGRKNQSHKHLNAEQNLQEHELIVKSNEFAVEIDDHILRVHKFMRDIYATKFPELEEMVINPIEYAKCVKMIANRSSEEMADLPLKTVLSNASVAMMVRVTASTTAGKQLLETDLKTVLCAADTVIALEDKKNTILEFVTSRMSMIAPNVSALIGPELTAQIIGLVGGIQPLSKMPACNVQVLGASKQPASGFALLQVDPHFGLIWQCDLVRSCPKELQQKVLRIVAAKVVLCARKDAHQPYPDASMGLRLYVECARKIEKLQEPPPPKPPRPLPVPDHKTKKKRGGKRYRRMRERYRVTETQRIQNRMAFNRPEEEIIDGNGEIIGLGMLGSASDVGGKLRVIAPKSHNTRLHKINKRQLQKARRMRAKAEKAGTVSGLHTSFSFTPVQGIELNNPELCGQEKRSNKYFNDDDVFAKKTMM